MISNYIPIPILPSFRSDQTPAECKEILKENWSSFPVEPFNFPLYYRIAPVSSYPHLASHLLKAQAQKRARACLILSLINVAWFYKFLISLPTPLLNYVLRVFLTFKLIFIHPVIPSSSRTLETGVEAGRQGCDE